jgi:hypothetical protein
LHIGHSCSFLEGYVPIVDTGSFFEIRCKGIAVECPSAIKQNVLNK